MSYYSRVIKGSHSFSTKIHLRVFLLSFMSSLIVCLLLLYILITYYQFLRDQVNTHTLELTRLSSVSVENSVVNTENILKSLSQEEDVKHKQGLPECNNFLAGALTRHPEYHNFGVADVKGDVVCSAVPLKKPVNISHRQYFQQTVQKHTFSIGEYQLGLVTNKPGINFAYPILDSKGNITHVIYAALSLEPFNNIIERARLVENAEFNIIDHNGILIARFPEQERYIGKSLPVSALAQAVVERKDAGTIRANGIDNVERLFGYTPLELKGISERNLYVSIGIPVNSYLGPLNNLFVRHLIILALVTIVVFFIAWVVSIMYIFPLVRRPRYRRRQLSTKPIHKTRKIPRRL